MPVYEYKCTGCGVFDRLTRLADRDISQPCPLCNQLAERVVLSAPALAVLSTSTRIAIETNERSQHAPKYHVHSSSCGCGTGSKAGNKTDSKVTTGGEVVKSFPSSRPWMISH